MAGLFEGLDLQRRLQNPLVQMGAQMLANSGPSLTPKGLFEGAPQAIQRGLQMQQEQAMLDQEEEAKAKTIELLRERDPELAAMIEASGLDAASAIQMVTDKRRREEEWAREDERWQTEREWELADRTAASMVPKMPDIDTFYDDETGQEYKGYIDPQTMQPVRVGGLKAPTSTQATTTEAERRNAAIYNTVLPELAVVEDNWEALSSVGDQAMNQVGARILTQEDYQEASNAVYVIAQHYLYSMSGQAAPEGEVQRVAESLMPRIGESAGAVADKKARLATVINTIKMGAGRALPPEAEQSAGGWEVIGVE